MFKQISNELLNFIKNSPSCYHAIDNMKQSLDENGFCEVVEGKNWTIK